MNVDWRAPDLPEGVVVRLLLMRHGEPVAAAKGRCYGNLDVTLSSTGREQVSRVVDELRETPLTAVYTSARTRARQSAKILTDATGAALMVDARLSEMDFGDLEGRTYDEVERTMPEFFAQWMQRPTEVQFPGGESYLALRERVCKARDEIKFRHTPGIVGVVAHGGVIRAMLANDLDLAPHLIFCLDQGYAGVTCVDYYGDTPVVRTVNWRP